jgi:ubiquinone/menaquinone biosynthesis C-methylase UbiE
MQKGASLFVLLLLQFLCVTPHSQNTSATQGEQRKTSTPYTGDLSVFDSPGRDERLQINRVMDILEITSGKNVADIGAGSGWFSVRAAGRVGDAGTVYAVDINPDAIRYIESRIRKDNLHNIKPILGQPENPLLPAMVDAVLMLKTYHEVAQPIALLRNLRHSLRPGAKIGVIALGLVFTGGYSASTLSRRRAGLADDVSILGVVGCAVAESWHALCQADHRALQVARQFS